MWKWILVAVLAAGPVGAQTWKMRDGDVTFEADALAARLSEQTLVFYDDAQSFFGADGNYSYIYGGGGLWEGRYEVRANSMVCVTFETGTERCDRIVENDGRLVVLTAKGERFPIRP